MNRLRDVLGRHSLSTGLLLMFLLTWPVDLALAGLLPFDVPFPVAFGLFLPIANTSPCAPCLRRPVGPAEAP